MSHLNVVKTQLRKTLMDRRKELGPSYRAEASKAIVEKLRNSVDWLTISAVHCYEPIPALNEVDISSLFSFRQHEFPRLQLYTSRKITNEWRIVTRSGDVVEPAPKLDIVIVPMLGFDAELQRMGYGGGYYDRFLATQPQAYKVGVCYKTGKLDSIPSEPHDIAMDMIITD